MPPTILDVPGRDSLEALVVVLEAYSDTVTKEITVLRATLDTAGRALACNRLDADSTIAAQGRVIAAVTGSGYGARCTANIQPRAERHLGRVLPRRCRCPPRPPAHYGMRP